MKKQRNLFEPTDEDRLLSFKDPTILREILSRSVKGPLEICAFCERRKGDCPHKNNKTARETCERDYRPMEAPPADLEDQAIAILMGFRSRG